MKFEVDEGIAGGVDQDIGVGQQRGTKPDRRRAPRFVLVRHRQCQRAAE
jgi:hypothetical protein